MPRKRPKGNSSMEEDRKAVESLEGECKNLENNLFDMELKNVNKDELIGLKP